MCNLAIQATETNKCDFDFLIPREQSNCSSAAQVSCIYAFFCLRPLTQNDQTRHGNTYRERRVFRRSVTPPPQGVPQRSPIFRFPSSYAYTLLTQNYQIWRCNTRGEGTCQPRPHSKGVGAWLTPWMRSAVCQWQLIFLYWDVGMFVCSHCGAVKLVPVFQVNMCFIFLYL